MVGDSEECGRFHKGQDEGKSGVPSFHFVFDQPTRISGTHFQCEEFGWLVYIGSDQGICFSACSCADAPCSGHPIRSMGDE